MRSRKYRVFRFTAIICVIAMLCSSLSFVYADSDNTKSVTVSISGSEFYLTPTEIKVAPDCASELGYTIDDPTSTSVFDAMAAAHKFLLGDEFNADTAKDYLDITSSGWINTILGMDASASGFFVNGITPNDGVLNPTYGSYTSYTADKAILNQGDNLQIFFYQDKSFYSDYYAKFDKSSVSATAGEEFKLNLSGFMTFMGTYPAEQLEASIEPISDIAILVGTDPNDLKPTEIVTDDNGDCTISFDTDGTYYISALSYSDDYTYFVLPWCVAEIGDAIAPTVSPKPVTSAEPSVSPSPSAGTEPADTDIRIKLLKSEIAKLYYDSTESWQIFDMICGGYSSRLSSKKTSIAVLTDEAYNASSASDLVRDGLALLSLGTNLTALKTSDATEYNLLERISEYSKDDFGYVTNAIMALTLYHAADYKPTTGITEYDLIDYILDSRNTSGLWGYSWEGMDYVDYDSTAMVLNAFAPYFLSESADEAKIPQNLYDEIINTVNTAVNALSGIQLNNGSLGNANTDAAAITGLAAVGINPNTDERFIKAGNSLINGILSYALDNNSGFGYLNNTEFNALATEQCFRALIAQLGLLSSKNGIYNIYDVKPITSSDSSSGGSASGGNSGGSTGGSSVISVSCSVKGDTVHGEGEHSGSYPIWIPSTKKSVASGSTVGELIKTILTENGYTVIGIDSGYIKSITSPDGITIGEGTNGKNSGWMYKVSGKSPSVGIGDYKLKSGDIVELYYTDDYTKDSASNNFGENSGGSGVVGTSVPSAAPTQTFEPEPTENSHSLYRDVSYDYWAFEYIKSLTDSGILNGDEDGFFRPEDSITRAEFTAMITRICGGSTDGLASEFSDVDSDEWYSGYVAWAAKNGIVNGVGNNSFEPNSPITREDICVMIVRSRELVGIENYGAGKIDNFADDSEISDYAREFVYTLAIEGIVNGYEDGMFKPKQNAARSEASKIAACGIL